MRSSNDNAYYGDYTEDKVLGEIGRLDAVTRTWSLAGSLKQARSGHAVVFDCTQFLVLGGYEYRQENFEIEHCCEWNKNHLLWTAAFTRLLFRLPRTYAC